MSATSQIQNVSRTASVEFTSVMDDFKSRLTDEERRSFAMTKLEDLEIAIASIQRKQATQKRLQGLRRLEVFLEGMKEYDKLISVFLNSSPILAFVWGPMKFLLQIASTWHEAFDALLDAYRRIGEHLPLVIQYEEQFRTSLQMSRLLRHLYEDLLSFHFKAMRYFKTKMWKQLFHALWKTFQSDFGSILDDMREHRLLIESQIAMTHYVEAMRTKELAQSTLEAVKAAETCRRRDYVLQWLSAPQYEADHEMHRNPSVDEPTTGQWIFQNQLMDSWLSIQACSTHFLWLTGIPGAGKTTLAAVVVEAIKKLPNTSIAFFYARYQDAERNTFIAIARGVLAQLVRQDQDLVPHIYDKASTSGETSLNSDTLAEELLQVSIKNSPKVHIVIDGIDECVRRDRKRIVACFQKIWETVPLNDKDSLRCMFISQNDKPAQDEFANMATLKITEDDIKPDILAYVRKRTLELQVKFELTDEMRSMCENLVVTHSEGMFLFAKLTCSYLLDQATLERLEAELVPQRFPEGPNRLDEMYSRIVQRLSEGAALREDTLTVLRWLVCAKRPLNWREVQCAASIDLDEEIVNWEKRRFRADSKELCGSLVELYADGTVRLVHQTAKRYLARQSFIDQVATETALANLCMGYLTLPSFDAELSEHIVKFYASGGHYGFIDYAYAYWSRHLTSSVMALKSRAVPSSLLEIADVFIDMHWIGPESAATPHQDWRDRWKPLENIRNFDKLLSAAHHANQQLHAGVQPKAEAPLLDLRYVLSTVRDSLESLSTNFKTDKFLSIYGIALFKCPRTNCTHFYNGFATQQQRENHLQGHDRKFFCTFPGCWMATLGCTSLKELQRHDEVTHGTIALDDGFNDFPDLPPEKVSYDCTKCAAKFTRNHNLKMHMKTHTGIKERSFLCATCGKSFERQGDRTRHESTIHAGAKSFTCGGTLLDGSSWGCGYECNRGDLLNRHWKSKRGQACVLRKRLEEETDPILTPPNSTPQIF